MQDTRGRVRASRVRWTDQDDQSKKWQSLTTLCSLNLTLIARRHEHPGSRLAIRSVKVSQDATKFRVTEWRVGTSRTSRQTGVAETPPNLSSGGFFGGQGSFLHVPTSRNTTSDR